MLRPLKVPPSLLKIIAGVLKSRSCFGFRKINNFCYGVVYTPNRSKWFSSTNFFKTGDQNLNANHTRQFENRVLGPSHGGMATWLSYYWTENCGWRKRRNVGNDGIDLKLRFRIIVVFFYTSVFPYNYHWKTLKLLLDGSASRLILFPVAPPRYCNGGNTKINGIFS